MLTLHYGTANGYSSNGENGSTYLDYTTLTNMSADRLSESKSPLAHAVHTLESSGSGNSGETSYGYYENMDTNGASNGYVHSPVATYSQTAPGKSPNYQYSLHGNNPPDGYSSVQSTEQLPGLVPSPLHHQITVTIGPGTTQQRTLPVIYDPMQVPKDTYGTYLSIIEQPTNRIRYRYRSEKGSHGGLNGENSSQMKKTYPTIKVENYRQSSPVYIRASLATNENKPKQHVHKLMGRHCSEDGACTLPVADNFTTIFQNLGILFIGKKEVPEILYKRKLADFQARYFNQTLTEKVKENLREQSEKEAKDMNLNSVKICFEAFVLQNEALYPICAPVYSRPIANQKSPDSGELKIIRINRYCGTVAGGDEVYLLCEKVNKKEIRVRFFEVDSEGNQQWEAFGHFNESDVHHQVAIVFRTPPYRDQNIGKPAQVYLQLYRQRDGEFSEPRTFIYKPKSDTNGDFGGDCLTIKSGIQECVLSRIRMENQPPGYKRRKYSHQHGTSKMGKGRSSTTSDAHGTSYLQRKGASKQRVQVKVQNAPAVVIKTESEANHEMCPLTSNASLSTHSANSSYPGQGGHMEATFCQGTKPPFVGNAKSGFLSLPRPIPRVNGSLSLPSPNSHSSSSPSSPSSAASLMLANALQQTVLDPTPAQQQQQQQQADSLDFDHLDAMWTPPSEPSPPLSVGDFFHSFIPMSSSASVSSTHSSSQQSSAGQSVTFVDMSQAGPVEHQSQVTLLDPLSIVSLDVAPSISLSPPMSTPSPTINTCNTSAGQQQQHQQYSSGSICMLYS